MQEQKYIVELVKEDIDDLVVIMDAVVKSQGLQVAERCVQLHKLILSAKPKSVEPPKPYVPTPEELAERELRAKEEMKKELDSLIEVKSEPKKSSPVKKSSKVKSTKKK